jgi:hypothetical protein
VDDAVKAEQVLAADPRVEEVSHYGHILRICTKGNADALVVTHELLAANEIKVNSADKVRATVEDAFVAMVRADERTLVKGAA